jgi:hypothetical protein
MTDFVSEWHKYFESLVTGEEAEVPEVSKPEETKEDPSPSRKSP